MEQRSRQRQRQMEKDDTQQRFAADADYINRKRVAIEQELECSDTDLQKLSDSDKERIKLEIDAIGKDHRMMEMREKKEQEDWMRRVEEDEVYIRRQLDSIEREERITLEKNMFFPKFTPFSGEDPKPKGEASYEEWRYEVNCIQRDKMYSKYVIGQAIRKSLRGQAKRVLLPSGVTATIEDIMDRLESVFGNIATGMSTLQNSLHPARRSRRL